MWHGWVAAIRVVLDDDERRVPPKMARERSYDVHLPLRRHVMQAVRGDHAVKGRQCEVSFEIGDQCGELDAREPVTHRPGSIGQGTSVPVDGDDVRTVAEQVRQGEREGASPSADVGPRPAARRNAATQKPDVVAVVHGGSVALVGGGAR